MSFIPEALLVIFIMTAGTTLQSTVGFGLGLVAGPFLVLIDRSYLPGPMLFAAMILTLLMAYRERGSIDFNGLKYSIFGRLISTPLAAVIIGIISATTFDILFGSLILAAVGMSLVHSRVKPTASNVFMAGIASGFMSTICAIGGPPLALVYQNARGPELRATLSALFFAGCVISLIALVLVGKFTLNDLMHGVIMTAGVLLGLTVSRPLIRMLDKNSIRPFVLGICCIAAFMVLGRALLQIL